MSDGMRSEQASALVLLVSDALAFTPELSERGRGILVGALRHAATKPVTQDDEEAWMKRMLDAKLQTTASFRPGWPNA